MEPIGVLMTLVFTAVVFTAVAVLFTCPGWLTGTLCGAGGTQISVNPLVSNRWRRRTQWILSCLGMALVAGIGYRQASPVLLLLWPVFLTTGQYFAFYMGYTRSAARKARRDNDEPVTGRSGPPTQVVRADDSRVFVVGDDTTTALNAPPSRTQVDDDYQPAAPDTGEDGYRPAASIAADWRD